MGMMTPSHKQAVAAYERELRRQTRVARLMAVLYTLVALFLMLQFFYWLSR